MSGDLQLNPNLSIFLYPNSEKPSDVIFSAPGKGRKCERIRIGRKKHPQLFEVLFKIARNVRQGQEINLTIPDPIHSELQRLGILLKRSKILLYPRFEISLPRSPDKSNGDFSGCIVNPTFRFVPKTTLNPYTRLLVPGKTWVEVQPPDCHVPSIFSTDRGSFKRFKPGKPAPNDLKLAYSKSLIQSGILIHSDRWVQQRKQLKKNLLDAASTFQRDYYVELPNLFSRSQIDGLAAYFRRIVQRGFLPLGDGHVSRRFSQHNEPIARLFQRRLTKVVSAISGEIVRPSYVFFGSYTEGAELSAHRDRSQCEFSISLLLDYQPTPKKRSPWPLFLERRGSEPIAIYQPIGGALLYRGRWLTHWRPVLPKGNTSTSLFLHYVRTNFKGALA